MITVILVGWLVVIAAPAFMERKTAPFWWALAVVATFFLTLFYLVKEALS